jgi:hypothetical protein
MSAVILDGVGHEPRPSVASGATELTFGAVSTTAVGTISPTTSAGAAPTTSAVTGSSCTDRRGRFNLNPVTGGGAQAAGIVAKVVFSKPYAVVPASVQVNLFNDTDDTAAVVASAGNITVTGFDIVVGTALTTAKVYDVSYLVTP